MRREIRENEVIVMNFSGIYTLEKFAHDSRFKVLDCRNFHGVDRYCDADAMKALESLIRPYPYEGIHFIDSGDYHYMTKLWTAKIGRTFDLIVFDHHTDMQEPAFGPILSCGDWVKETLDTNPYLRKVILAGPPEKMKDTLEPEYRDRIDFHPEGELVHGDGWRKYLRLHDEVPVYISIDKDVLSRKSCPTNWDQGSLPLLKFDDILSAIIEKEHVIGVDICGECSPSLDFLEKKAEAAEDNAANVSILKTILTSVR